MAKPFDPKAKAKRQKIIAGALGLVLVAVLIFQGPTIMGMFGGSSTTASEPTPAAPPPPPAPGPAPATPGAPAAAPGPAAIPAAGSAALVDSDPTPLPADGQLVSFDRFESKDPFAQQAEATGGPTRRAAPKRGRVDTSSGAKADEPKGGGRRLATAPAPVEVVRPAADRSATITVNGASHEVSVGESFPEGDPIFKLVSLKRGIAKVGIVGGSYANGSQTISLTKGGKPVTLMNTADGTTYVLRLVG